MRPQLLSRTLHKWLALIVGIQIAFWTVSGFYMVVVDLDFIHGDTLVRNLRVPLGTQKPRVTFNDVARRFEGVTAISLRALPGQAAPLYEVTIGTRLVLVDAVTGRQLSPLSQDVVRDLSRQYYAGSGQLASLTLIEQDAPLEIQTRALPLWRADFDDWLQTSLYLHPDTGVLVTRRHRLWRWFDFVWMLHIMDYESRTDVNNGLLRTATIAGLVTVLSGCWLLYFSFRRRDPAQVSRS
jgi:hypothetical protein